MTAAIETLEARGVGSTFGESTPLSSFAEWMVVARAVQLQRDQLLWLFEEPKVDMAEGIAKSRVRAAREAGPDAYADAASFLLRYMSPYAATHRKTVAKLNRLSVAEIAALPKQEVWQILSLEEAGRQVLSQEEFIATRGQYGDPWNVNEDALQIIDTALAFQMVYGSEDLVLEAADVRASGFLHLAALTLE